MKKENFPQSSGTESFIFSSCVESTADCSLSEGCRALCWLSSIHAWWRMRRRRVMIFFISLRQVMRLYSTMIYRWVNSGQEPIPALPHICILGGQFFLDCVTRASRPRLLMRTLWVQIPFRSVDCVRRHVWAEGKKKKSTGALQNVIKQNGYLHSVCRHAFSSLSGSRGRVLVNYKCLCVDEFMHVCVSLAKSSFSLGQLDNVTPGQVISRWNKAALFCCHGPRNSI